MDTTEAATWNELAARMESLFRCHRVELLLDGDTLLVGVSNQERSNRRRIGLEIWMVPEASIEELCGLSVCFPYLVPSE